MELTMSDRMVHTRHSLPLETRESMVALLNQQLADTFDLHSQLKQAHWNVKGMHFQQLHELFDAVAAVVQGFVDEIAERATALGGVAEGTTRMAARTSRLSEIEGGALTGEDAVKAVAERVSAVAASSRTAIEQAGDAGDEVTADLFTGIARTLDTQLYFIESHLQS